MLRQKTDDKTVYRVTKREGNKSKPLTVQELTVNVKTLVRKVFNNTGVGSDKNQADEQPALIVGRKVSHALHGNDAVTWYTGQVISQVITNQVFNARLLQQLIL